MATAGGLAPRRVNEVMTRGVEVLHPSMTIDQAAERMKALDVGALPVCDGNRLQGMLTDRDIVLRVVAEHRNPESVRVHDVMSAGVAYCFDDQTVEDVARLMQEKQIRRLPVLNRENEMVGIVSLGDLAAKTDETTTMGEALGKISEPTRPKRNAI